MADLPTNFKDDILDTSVNTRRRYRVYENTDGTIELEDVTEYSQVGDEFGAGQINATNMEVNKRFDKNMIVRYLDTINAITKEGYVPDALALKEVNDRLTKVKTYVGSDGKLHFRDASGADSVLPFSSMKRFYTDAITLSSTEKTYEIGFRPKFFMIGMTSQNFIVWYDVELNKYFYNGYINSGVDVGTTEISTGNKICTLTEVTDNGFSFKVVSSFNGKNGFILAFG